MVLKLRFVHYNIHTSTTHNYFAFHVRLTIHISECNDVLNISEPNPPDKLTAYGTTTNCTSIMFISPMNDSSYSFNLTKVSLGEKDSTEVKTVMEVETRDNVCGLSPGSVYNISIVSIYKGLVSSPGDVVTISTGTLTYYS